MVTPNLYISFEPKTTIHYTVIVITKTKISAFHTVSLKMKNINHMKIKKKNMGSNEHAMLCKLLRLDKVQIHVEGRDRANKTPCLLA